MLVMSQSLKSIRRRPHQTEISGVISRASSWFRIHCNRVRTCQGKGSIYLYFSTYPTCCSHRPHEMHMAADSLYDASCDSCRSCWLWCSISPLAAAPSPASHGLRSPGCCCLRLSAHKSFPGPGKPGLRRPGPPGPGYPGRSE